MIRFSITFYHILCCYMFVLRIFIEYLQQRYDYLLEYASLSFFFIPTSPTFLSVSDILGARRTSFGAVVPSLPSS